MNDFIRGSQSSPEWSTPTERTAEVPSLLQSQLCDWCRKLNKSKYAIGYLFSRKGTLGFTGQNNTFVDVQKIIYNPFPTLWKRGKIYLWKIEKEAFGAALTELILAENKQIVREKRNKDKKSVFFLDKRFFFVY